MTKRIKLRTLLIGGLVTLLFAVLMVRVYFVQVVHAEFWYAKAKQTWSAYEKIQAQRGTITDRSGNILAMDVTGYTVAVSPKVINELGIERPVVEALHRILGKPEDELMDIVTRRNADGEFFMQREVRSEGWKIDKDVADQIMEFREELRSQIGKRDVGLYFIEEQKRFYPRQTLAAHVLGYMNKEGEAMSGLERSLDDMLRGTDGHIRYERDGNRVQLSKGDVEHVQAVDGKNITLTIDSDIQWYIEQAIKEAYEKYQPKYISAIAADPHTMEILGMASLPSYNPNVYWEKTPGDDFNYAIRGLMEPGSTFKIVTLAAAVEEGVFDPNETYKSGSIRVADRTLRDHRREGWGEITYLEGLKRSSNVAFVKLGYEKMTSDTLKSYIRDFGFGQKTGIELGGEQQGMENAYWPAERATLTYGQGKVQVTPIQQVAAVAAIANGGRLLQPHFVKKVEDPMTKKVQTIKPKLIRQVVSPETAHKVGLYLEQVVSDQEMGTGKNAYIDGYRVAGKTGTAQKVIGGEYAKDKFLVSFIGYAPVDNPRIVVYVVVDEPNDPFAGGGSAAAPVFKEIVLNSLRYMGVGPDHALKPLQRLKSTAKLAPDVTELKAGHAISELKARQIGYEVIGDGGKVLRQIPSGGSTLAAGQKIYLITEDNDKLKIPNMTGLALRDALAICAVLELKCAAEGSGFVLSQALREQNGDRLLVLTLAHPGGGEAAMPEQSGTAHEEEEQAADAN